MNVELINLGPGDDVIDSLLQICREKNIRSGVVLSMVGDIDGAKLSVPGSEVIDCTQDGCLKSITLEGQFEMFSSCGFINYKDNELQAHVHGSFGDMTGSVYGGHLISGNKVLHSVEIAIGILEMND